MFELHAKTREAGKKLGTLRRLGRVPAVLYGPGVEPLALETPQGDFERAFAAAGESSLLKLLVESDGSSKPHVVLIRGVARDPLRGVPIHLDFHAVRLDAEIKIDVPFNFVGQAPIETRGEGVVVKDLHELEVEAFPENLPHEIDIDISGFDTVDAEFRVRDVVLPKGVRAVTDSDLVVAHAAPLISEAEISAIETSTDEGLASVEVITEKKEGASEAEGENEKEIAQ